MMRRIVYYAALAAMIGFTSLGIGTLVRLVTLVQGDLVFLASISVMCSFLVALIAGAVAHRFYMTPYEREEWRKVRAERRSQRLNR